MTCFLIVCVCVSLSLSVIVCVLWYDNFLPGVVIISPPQVLKYVGLSKIRKAVTNSGLDSITDLDDSGNEYYDQQPHFLVAPPPAIVAQSPTYFAQSPSYYPHTYTPLPLASPPAFYIVPASGLQNFRSRRDVSVSRYYDNDL